MGYMRHHGILVTGYDGHVDRARDYALTLFRPEMVSAMSGEVTNGYRSFAIFPDGSKEGWDTSDDGNSARKAWIAWARSHAFDDGSSPIAWVEVQYGDDECETRVCDDSDVFARADLEREQAMYRVKQQEPRPPGQGGG